MQDLIQKIRATRKHKKMAIFQQKKIIFFILDYPETEDSTINFHCVSRE